MSWKLTEQDKSRLIMYGIGGVVGLVLINKFAGAVGDAARKAGNAVNPTNNQNIFARASNAVADVLDNGNSDGSTTFGGWIYDLTHKEPKI